MCNFLIFLIIKKKLIKKKILKKYIGCSNTYYFLFSTTSTHFKTPYKNQITYIKILISKYNFSFSKMKTIGGNQILENITFH